MLNLKGVYSDKRGFTLIELIVGIVVISILFSSIYSLLFFTNRVTDKADHVDTLLYNGRYAMEYIKGEIIAADKVICSSKFEDLDRIYSSNIGFVTMEEQCQYDKLGHITNVNYNFRTYYQKKDELIRIAYNTPNKSLLDGKLFSGNNLISDGLRSLNHSILDVDNNLIKLFIELEQGDAELVLESTINLRCPVQ